jgi:hypothetical protein
MIGLALGFALAFGSFGRMLIMALFAVISWLLALLFSTDRSGDLLIHSGTVTTKTFQPGRLNQGCRPHHHLLGDST